MDGADSNIWEQLFVIFLVLFILIAIVAVIAIESAIAEISKAINEQELASAELLKITDSMIRMVDRNKCSSLDRRPVPVIIVSNHSRS